MGHAIELAVENARGGRGGPFAALVVKDGAVIASGVNLVTANHDPTAHAEIEAIRAACRTLDNFQLTGCDIYATSEPCPMCLGAIYWARPARVFFAATRSDAARARFDDSFIYDQLQAPIGERRIPMRQLLREQALRAFREWDAAAGKVAY
jgi:guanine deaminase